MAAKHSLVVLAPNGRRQTLNVTQNTSIQEVLEIVCKKHDLDFNEWDLKHYNRIIELTNTVRFSGLPNNASLEMVQLSKPRKETTITLMLQLETGKRLRHEFASSANLWDVLKHWQNNGEPILLAAGDASPTQTDNVQPVCIYMRQEIYGEERLKKASLRSLGLTHGAACIRLIHRSENQLKNQANISAPLAARPPPAEVTTTTRENDPRRGQHVAPVPALQSYIEERKAASSPPPPEPSPPQPEAQEEVSMDVEEQASKNDLQGSSHNEESRKFNEKPHVPEYLPPPSKLAPDGQLNILGENDVCFYFSGDVSRLNLQADQDDSFYEITRQDVQRRQRDLNRKREELENTPLQIAAVRELEREEMKRRILAEHPSTTIKVRFPNGYILQGIFSSNDTIGAVAAVVRKYLADPSLNFYLLVTPPRTILSNDVSLIEQNLIGNAVVYFGCDCDYGGGLDLLKSELYEKLSCPDSIRQHYQQKLKTTSARNPEASMNTPGPSGVQASGAPQPQQSSTNDGGTSQQASSSAAAPRPVRPAQNSGIVPKWFRK